jgi:hypothetical protein
MRPPAKCLSRVAASVGAGRADRNLLLPQLGNQCQDFGKASKLVRYPERSWSKRGGNRGPDE